MTPPVQRISTNERLVDLFMERAVDLVRLEAGTRDRVLVFLHELETEISSAIVRVDAAGVRDAARQRKRLQDLLKFVSSTIRSTYRDISTLLAREIREVADLEYAWTANAFNTATRASFVDTVITRGFLQTLVSNVLIQGATSRDWWSRQAQGLADRFADEMRKGMALGETNAKLVERLRGPSGLMRISHTSAERLVRASVQAAANTARESMYDRNSDLIKALQWSATLDTRTSVYCITRDGHNYSPDRKHTPLDGGPKWLEGPGKIHWGCRSTSVPVLKSWRELGIDADEVPETTRASMDGQVPAQTTFETWLKKQPIERQNTVLGVGKADLWRSGKIDFRDLVDQNGRPLTTEELRAKASRA